MLQEPIRILKEYLASQQQKVRLSIEKEKNIRDTSPSAMQSHHDTTRNQTEKLIHALEAELKVLDNNINLIPESQPQKSKEIALWNLIKVDLDGSEITILLVPEGLGGKKIDYFTTVSEFAPLGQVVKNKVAGSEFILNGKRGKILSLS